MRNRGSGAGAPSPVASAATSITAVADKFSVTLRSGLGVVSCLAALAGFRASGVEARGRLVRGARQLAARFDLPAEFARGSFFPKEGSGRLLAGREFAWLSTGGRCGHEALGAGPEEFDLIYAYPWPDEEALVAETFEARASCGALLLTYHGEFGLRLRRKYASLA